MDRSRSEALLARAAQGDAEACSRLVEMHSGLIWSVARRFTGRGCELEDLYQLGCMGLLKAIKRFDPSYQVQFSTYAVPVITGEIKRFLRDDGIIKVGRPLRELAARAYAAAEALRGELGREPGIQEIARRLKVQPEELSMALDACTPPESLQHGMDDGEGSPFNLIDRLGDPDANPEHQAVDRVSLRQALTSLEPREKKIILLRFFKHRTQAQVARELGISQVQVSRLEKSILQSLKKCMMA
ncbi:MAG TPA: RNA polymerase sigma-G factor [Clostridiales bacterium]|nr:RNA polymerase sigma-G factor [Clostridiales bacterium]